jgi:riboflavin kinase/FMN adenylyltransferase
MKKKIFALGFFDGVHLGHRMLLGICRYLAKATGNTPAAVTFDTHPSALTTGKAPLLINTVDERLRMMLPMCDVLVLPFNEDLRNQHWQDFLEDLIAQDAAGFVCGYDFRFGCRGEGTADLLAQFCRERKLAFRMIPQQLLDDTRISSTHIRQLIENGEMEQAVRFLGHPHILSGKVIRGQQLGRTLGIPTANLELPPQVVCPKFGVYACRAIVDGSFYAAVTNIGTRPTVDGQGVTVEPWLLDFDGDLYGKEVTLEFYKFLRPEQKFENLEALKAQIQKDAEETRKIIV